MAERSLQHILVPISCNRAVEAAKAGVCGSLTDAAVPFELLSTRLEVYTNDLEVDNVCKDEGKAYRVEIHTVKRQCWHTKRTYGADPKTYLLFGISTKPAFLNGLASPCLWLVVDMFRSHCGIQENDEKGYNAIIAGRSTLEAYILVRMAFV